MDDAAKGAGLPPHRSAHGLRKVICVRLAEAGCDPYEIMAVTGRRDIKEVQTYVAAANKRRQAQSAITKQYGAA
jgi:integrase